MAIALTNIGTANAKTGATSAVVTASSGVPAGSLIVLNEVTGTGNAGPNHGTLSDTGGNTWTTGPSVTNSGAVWCGCYYAFNCLAIGNGGTITQAWSGSSIVWAVSAFYATGVQTTSDPIDITSINIGAKGTNPSTNLGSAATNGDLVLGLVGFNGPVGDSITQDSTNGSYATPPSSTGTTGGSAVSNVTLFGGSLVAATSTAWVYAPTDSTSQRAWASIVATFLAAASGPQTYNDTITETGSAADAMATIMTMDDTLSEAGSAADTMVGGILFIDTISEAGSAADNFAEVMVFTFSLSETGAAADTYATLMTMVNTLTESGSAADTYATVMVMLDTLAEAGSAADSFFGGQLLVDALTEAGSASDNFVAARLANVTIAEAGTASDAYTTLMAMTSALTETGAAADSYSPGLVILVALSEAGTASDTMAGGMIFSDTLSESGSAADAYATLATLVSTLLEVGSAADSFAASGGGGGPTITGNIWPWVRHRRRIT